MAHHHLVHALHWIWLLLWWVLCVCVMCVCVCVMCVCVCVCVMCVCVCVYVHACMHVCTYIIMHNSLYNYCSTHGRLGMVSIRNPRIWLIGRLESVFCHNLHSRYSRKKSSKTWWEHNLYDVHFISSCRSGKESWLMYVVTQLLTGVLALPFFRIQVNWWTITVILLGMALLGQGATYMTR